MPFSVGPMEIVVVLAIALLVLGPKRLPEAGKAVGREFKNSVVGGSDDGDAPELTLPATESDAHEAPAKARGSAVAAVAV
jgi:sec-independent protein translocase protein TatA